MHTLSEWPPLTDDEVRALGYEPRENGWYPIRSDPHSRDAQNRPETEPDSDPHPENEQHRSDPHPPDAQHRPEVRSKRATVRVARTPRPH